VASRLNQDQAFMDWNRILSGTLAGLYLILAFISGGAEAGLKMVLFLLLPLACIWFSEEMGDYTGIIRGQSMTNTSPGCLVRLLGWVLLLMPIIAGVIMYWQTH
jgi:hypothetical protein